MTIPYADPGAITNGQTSAASWGVTVRNDLQTLSARPGAAVLRTTAQTIANATTATIVWSRAARDTDQLLDVPSGSHRLIIPSGLGGLYRLTAYIGWHPSTSGFRQIGYSLNGTAITRSAILPAPAGVATQHGFAVEILLAAGDYIELWAFQNTGGTLDVTDADCSLTWLGVA